MLGGKGGAAAGGHAQVKMWQPGLLLVTRGWCWGQDPPGTTAVQLRVSARLQAGGGPTELAPGWAQGGQRRCWDPRGHSGQRGPGPARWQSCPVPALGCAHIRTRRRVWCSPVPRGRWRGLCLSPTVKQAPRSLPETHSRPWPRRRHHPRTQQVPAARPQERDGCHRPRRVSRGSQCPAAGASRDLHPCPARAWGRQPGLGRARGAGSGGARGCGRGQRTRMGTSGPRCRRSEGRARWHGGHHPGRPCCLVPGRAGCPRCWLLAALPGSGTHGPGQQEHCSHRGAVLAHRIQRLEVSVPPQGLLPAAGAALVGPRAGRGPRGLAGAAGPGAPGLPQRPPQPCLHKQGGLSGSWHGESWAGRGPVV